MTVEAPIYSTCLFCNSALGVNESIELFPVGRRLAFDSATGRLWVVCGKCERWNLSPLESRWEAIEEAERAYRNTKLHVSTDNIGLARLSEGTELVRVGKPLRPEFAAWRYGDQFGKRRRAFIAKSLVGFGALNATPLVVGMQGVADYMSLGPILPLTIAMGVLTFGGFSAGSVRLWRDNWIPAASVRGNDGRLLWLSRMNMQNATIASAGHGFDWQLKLEHLATRQANRFARMFGVEQARYIVATPAVLRHDAVRNALAKVLPLTNSAGGGKRGVKDALSVLSDAPSVQYLMHLAATVKSKRRQKTSNAEIHLGALPASLRLALEMSLHEDDERRAMEGELKVLEQRWREADAIAKIADEMFLPATIDESLKSLRGPDGAPK